MSPNRNPRPALRSSALAAIAALAFVVAGASCTQQRVYRLTEDRYPANPAPDSVKMYINTVSEPHVRIAHVNSFAALEDTPEVRREQLVDLQRRAARLGAEAVVDVRRLKNKGRGYVPDERPPFPAVRQGEIEQYFLRGTAIRYAKADETTTPSLTIEDMIPPPETTGKAGEIPAVVTREPVEPEAGAPPPR